jgi:hypothetical protein
VDLELAKKLHQLGMCWKYNDQKMFKTQEEIDGKTYDVLKCYPSLSQLLAEIEREGYDYLLGQNTHDGYGITIASDKNLYQEGFNAKTPEDAAGQALLWILQPKEGGNDGR